jgi:hypothetical protein
LDHSYALRLGVRRLATTGEPAVERLTKSREHSRPLWVGSECTPIPVGARTREGQSVR